MCVCVCVCVCVCSVYQVGGQSSCQAVSNASGGAERGHRQPGDDVRAKAVT